MIQPWPKLDSVPLGDFHIFRLRKDRKTSPRTGQPHEFYILDTLDWVNVVAVTPDQQLVMVEQYRHGTDTVELEIPGGMLNHASESPLAAGLRELREETGYAGEEAQILAEVQPNPAFMSNRCFTVLVQNCQERYPIEWDHGEDMITRLVPVSELRGLIIAGKIRHSIILAALYHFELWRQRD